MQLTAPLARLAAALAAVAALAAPAVAARYEVTIAIDDEQDLHDLHATGQISDETLELLVELYQRGIDLNRATREELYSLPDVTYAEADAILAYRDLVGWIHDPIDLVEAGVLTQARLESIAAFLVVGVREGGGWSADGWVRAQARWSGALSVGDGHVEEARDREYLGIGHDLPATAVQARVTTFQNLTVGAAATVTQQEVGSVRWDPVRQALSAGPEETRVVVPKYFAKWETKTLQAIAGTYRIGFGQRLTFDNTRIYTPNGIEHDDQLYRSSYLVRGCKQTAGELPESPCDGEVGDVYVTPDFDWQESLLGVAAGVRKIPLGQGTFQAYGFASYQRRSIYQYELYDKGTCDDPTDDAVDGCAAPDVYRRTDDPLAQQSRYTFTTLPDVFADTTVGGNAAFTMGHGHVGATAYTSGVDFLVDGVDLDFQEWSRYPRGGRFGAAGIDGGFSVDKVDLFAEATRSFDGNPDGGGGWGGIVRGVTSTSRRDELELSLRWYGEDFANPFARAIAAADEVDGLRARDERGVRLRYAAVFDRRLSLRTSLDVWENIGDERWNLLGYVRGDYALNDQFGVGGWLQHQDKDLGEGGRGSCFDFSYEVEGEPVPCIGQSTKIAARFRYTPVRRMTFTAQYVHEFVDDPKYEDRFRQDAGFTLTASLRPIEDLAVRGRIRYLSDDTSDDAYLEESMWLYAEVSYRIRARDWLRVRYDNYAYLDDRAATQTRVPSPEHWLALEYESRF